MSTDAEKKDKEILTPFERALEAMAIIFLPLLFVFFAYHQWADTGFFTDDFGQLEMFCLYGPIVFSVIPPVIRALTGRRNPARLFDAASSLFLAAGSLWLFITFPFDFSHLADIFPRLIRSYLFWLTDGIGKVLLLIQVVLGPISAIPKIPLYFVVRRRGEAEAETETES